MQSNQNQTLFLKYGLIAIGSLFTFILTANYLTGKGFVTAEGDSYEMTFYDLASSLIFPILIVMLGVYLKDRVVALELGAQQITIDDGSSEEKIKWSEVDKIRLLWFVQPPLYILRIKEREGYYLFATGWFSVNLGGFVWDPSEMGDYIKLKRKEYGFK